jgi:hypothetical protein
MIRTLWNWLTIFWVALLIARSGGDQYKAMRARGKYARIK